MTMHLCRTCGNYTRYLIPTVHGIVCERCFDKLVAERFGLEFPVASEADLVTASEPELDIGERPTAPSAAILPWTTERLRAAMLNDIATKAPDERLDCLIEMGPDAYCACGYLQYLEIGPMFPLVPRGRAAICPVHYQALTDLERHDARTLPLAPDAFAMLVETRAQWYVEAAEAQAERIATRYGWQ